MGARKSEENELLRIVKARNIPKENWKAYWGRLLKEAEKRFNSVNKLMRKYANLYSQKYRYDYDDCLCIIYKNVWLSALRFQPSYGHKFITVAYSYLMAAHDEIATEVFGARRGTIGAQINRDSIGGSLFTSLDSLAEGVGVPVEAMEVLGVCDDRDVHDVEVWEKITSGLSKAQKKHITMLYVENKSLEDIANYSGFCKASATNKLTEARAYIRRKYQTKEELQCAMSMI